MKLLITLTLSILLISCASTSLKTTPQESKKFAEGAVSFSVKDAKTGECKQATSNQKMEWNLWLAEANNCFLKSNWTAVENWGELMSSKTPHSPWGFYYLSLVAEKKLNYPRAEWMLNQAINKTPNLGILYYQKAKIRLAQGNLQQAYALMEQAVSLDDSITPAHKYLGLTYYRDQDYEKANIHLSKLSNSNLYDTQVKIGLMESNLKLGNNSKAISLAIELQKSNTKNWKFDFRLAEIYEQSPDGKSKALQIYKKISRSTKKSVLGDKLSKELPDKISRLEAEIRELASVSDESESNKNTKE